MKPRYIIAIMVGLALLYPLSFGPVYLVTKPYTQSEYMASEESRKRAFAALRFYSPCVYLCRTFPPYSWYISFWMRRA